MKTMQNNNADDIVISAIGFNSPYGFGKETYWGKVKDNKIDQHPMLEIEDYDPQKFLYPKGQKFLNKATLIYCNVAFQAIHERNLTNTIKQYPERIGLYDGSELSNLEDSFIFDFTTINEGPSKVSPMRAPNTIANAAASQMAIQAGIKGPNFSVCNGAPSSIQALDIAYVHLKQNLIDFGIVASTEIENQFKQSILEGEGRNNNLNAPELGISLVVEKRASLVKENKNPYAVINQIISSTQLNNEDTEYFLLRLIKQTLKNHAVDMILLSGGVYNININKFENVLKEMQIDIPVIYPENILGDNDNAGGLLGIVYAIGLFNEEIIISDFKFSQSRNVLVLSIDKMGTAISVLISD